MRKLFTRLMNRYRDMSMAKKISVSFFSMLLPILILAGVMFYNMLQNNNYYRQATMNTTTISKYSIDFTKNYDYKVYLILVGNKTYTELNPLDDIKQARDILTSVREKTNNSDSQDLIDRMWKNLDHLEQYTMRIYSYIDVGGHYDDNMEIWETAIQPLTATIQQNMLELLFYENQESARVYKKIEDVTVGMIGVSVAVFVVLIAFAISIVVLLPRTITKPIKELSTVTEQVAKGDLSVRSSIQHGAELKVLSDSLNVMIRKISSLIEDVKTEQSRLREAELEILQVQINPHFLYNTLDTIVWLAEADDMDAVVEMVGMLSDFFRASLGGGKDVVSIEEETKHITSYLQIQKVRYQDILEYEITIPEELKNVKIPKITLQPLVENALYHGIKNKRGKGTVKVYGYEEDGECILVVEDDGKGMTPEELQEVERRLLCDKEEEKESYGLYNVNERIRLRFGDYFGLHFESEYGKGTKVTVKLPMRV